MTDLGMHLMMEGVVPPALMASLRESKMKAWLLSLVCAMEMTAISKPFVLCKRGAWHGYILIAESHVTFVVHPKPDGGGYAFVDAFSCKSFNPVAVTSTVQALLGLALVQTQIIRREMAPVL